MDLRKDFFNLMIEIAEDPKVLVMVGDLGYSKFEEYKEKRPNQFINAGIMEQGMLGISAGMALGGMRPFVYTTAIFGIMRGYEQFRDDIAYANLNVKLIGTSSAEFLGHTHNFQGTENVEDLLKNLPNLKRFYPKTREQLKEALLSDGPTYIGL